jgi:hypothetical protein
MGVPQLHGPANDLLMRIGMPPSPRKPAAEKPTECFARNGRELAHISDPGGTNP